MIPLRFRASILLCLILPTLALVQPAAADTAELKLMSQPGDFIGQGQTVDNVYTPANSLFFSAQVVALVSGMPAYLRFVLGSPIAMPNTFTTLDFSTQQLGIPFQPGVYGLPGNTAQRAAFAQPGHAGLDVSFQNRGSNTLTGNFTVNSVQFFKDASNNFQIGSLDVNFEQHSEGLTPALFGRFTFFATGFGPSAVPESGTTAMLLLVAFIGVAAFRPMLASARK